MNLMSANFPISIPPPQKSLLVSYKVLIPPHFIIKRFLIFFYIY